MKSQQKYRDLLYKSIALILMVIAFVQPFQKVLITTAFLLNRSYIAENLCENQDNPALHCAGICQLKKNLKEAKERQQQETIAQFSIDVQFLTPTNAWCFAPDFVELKTTTPTFPAPQICDSELSGIFRPPLAA